MNFYGHIVVTLIDETGAEHKRAVTLESLRSDEPVDLTTYFALVKAGEMAADEIDKRTRGRLIVAPDGGLGMRPH